MQNDRMKSLTIVLFSLCLLVSCKKSDSEGRPDQVGLNKCQNRVVRGQNLTVCFKELLTDSRCPANAMCIWQGVAISVFTVSVGNDNHQITLGTQTIPSMCSKDTIVSGYKVEFLDLSPYPGMPTVPNEETRAEVKITKL